MGSCSGCKNPPTTYRAGCRQYFGRHEHAAACTLSPITGELDELFAVDISGNERLVFEIAHDPMPRTADQGIDKARVTEIIVLRIEDYHGR
jgi:hypothetical protein